MADLIHWSVVAMLLLLLVGAAVTGWNIGKHEDWKRKRNER